MNFIYPNRSIDSKYVFDIGFDKIAGTGKELSIEVFI
jgi:hypothetical protein